MATRTGTYKTKTHRLEIINDSLQIVFAFFYIGAQPIFERRVHTMTSCSCQQTRWAACYCQKALAFVWLRYCG